MTKSAQPVDWHVELWPNRSLSRQGLRAFLLMLGGCFAVFFLMTATAPGSKASPTGLATVLLMVIPFILLVFGCVVWAFAANNREGRYVERLHFDGSKLIIETRHPHDPSRREPAYPATAGYSRRHRWVLDTRRTLRSG